MIQEISADTLRVMDFEQIEAIIIQLIKERDRAQNLARGASVDGHRPEPVHCDAVIVEVRAAFDCDDVVRKNIALRKAYDTLQLRFALWRCDALGWHKAPTDSSDECCPRCGAYVLQDSQGNWFSPAIRARPSPEPEPQAGNDEVAEALDDAIATLLAVRATASSLDDWEQAADHFHKLCGETIRRANPVLMALKGSMR